MLVVYRLVFVFVYVYVSVIVSESESVSVSVYVSVYVGLIWGLFSLAAKWSANEKLFTSKSTL